MTYEEFTTDPFGTKKQAIKNYNNKGNKNPMDGSDDRLDEGSDEGQGKVFNLADDPQQPRKLRKRQTNQIHILNS
jgi:hypothetical protein